LFDIVEERRVDSLNAIELIAGIKQHISNGTLIPDVITPAAVTELPVADLVEAQQAVDRGAVLTVSQATSSSGNYLVGAGLGLLFLAISLGVSAKYGE